MFFLNKEHHTGRCVDGLFRSFNYHSPCKFAHPCSSIVGMIRSLVVPTLWKISFQLSNEHKTSSIPSGRNRETYSRIVAPKRCTKDSNYQYFQQDFTRHVYLSGNFSGKFNQVAKSIFTKFHLFVLYHYFLEAAIFKPIPPMVCL